MADLTVHIGPPQRQRRPRVAIVVLLTIPLLLNLVGIVGLLAPATSAAETQQAGPSQYEVRVTFERVEVLDDVDGPGAAPDFYAEVFIDGRSANNKSSVINDQSTITPGWQFFEILPSGRPQIPVRIKLFDEDGFLRGDDEEIDISPNEGRALDLTVDMGACTFSGDGITGSCGVAFATEGGANDRAAARLRIDVLPAQAVSLSVTIERVRELDCFDEVGLFCGSDADFYGRVTLYGQEIGNRESPMTGEDIRPNWRFTKQVNLNPGAVGVTIKIYDDDDNDDDHADISPDGDRDVHLSVDLRDCFARAGAPVTGDVPGGCDVTLASEGGSGDNAAIEFRIVVELPPSTPGLNVRCSHTDIWPQPGQQVTLDARALDGDRSPDPRLADVEIWFNSRTAPLITAPLAQQLTTTVGPFNAGDTFAYGCLARDATSGQAVWSGWRTVQVGQPPSGPVVPVLYAGPRTSSIDLVLIPDRNNYTGPADPAFLADVARLVNDAYYSEAVYLANQDKVNFWIGLDPGLAEDSADGCDHEAPDQLLSQFTDPARLARGFEYMFADTFVLMHRNSVRLGQRFRDCAPGGRRVFSIDLSRGDFDRVALHETGHRPFGLADEYPPDGGYYQNDPFPNVYESREACIGDLTNLQVFDERLGEAVRSVSSCVNFVDDYYRSDPAYDVSSDLMAYNGEVQGADLRRKEWLFRLCAQADCGNAYGLADEDAIQGDVGPLAGSPGGDPIPAIDYAAQRANKTIAVGLDFTALDQASLRAAEAGYGSSYTRRPDPPLLRVRLTDDAGQLVDEYNAWHPLWNRAWEGGRERLAVAAAEDGLFAIPFAPQLKWMEVFDRGGRPIVAVDLKPAINRFCAANPADPDCLADLALTLDGPEGPVAAGGRVDYLLTVSNSGPVGASEVSVRAALPREVTLVSIPAGCAAEAGGAITCSLGSLDVGASAQIPLRALANAIPGAASNRSLTAVSSAEVSAAQRDPDLADNRAEHRLAIRSSRVGGDLVLYYSFEEGTGAQVHDLAGAGEPLHLTVGDPAATVWADGGLSVRSPTVLTTAALPEKVRAAVLGTEEVTLEAWVRPEAAQQVGLARIVSISGGLFDRNLTLSQEREGDLAGDGYVARLYTAANTPNGRVPDVKSRRGGAGELAHVVYTRDALGRARLYIDGALRAERQVPGGLSVWETDHPLLLANELGGGRPWLGDYELVALYGRALSPSEVLQNFGAGLAGDQAVRELGAQALYAFDEGGGAVVRDRAGVAEPLDLAVRDPGAVRWTPEGLEVLGPTLIASTGDARRLVDAANASGELTIEAWVAPAAGGRSGPGVILGVARDRRVAALELRQLADGGAFVARLRAGAISRLESRPPASRGALTHLVLTRDARGVTRLYVDGVLQSTRTIAGPLAPTGELLQLVLASDLGGSFAWRGTLRGVALLNRALSPAEVARRAASGPP